MQIVLCMFVMVSGQLPQGKSLLQLGFEFGLGLGLGSGLRLGGSFPWGQLS